METTPTMLEDNDQGKRHRYITSTPANETEGEPSSKKPKVDAIISPSLPMGELEPSSSMDEGEDITVEETGYSPLPLTESMVVDCSSSDILTYVDHIYLVVLPKLIIEYRQVYNKHRDKSEQLLKVRYSTPINPHQQLAMSLPKAVDQIPELSRSIKDSFNRLHDEMKALVITFREREIDHLNKKIVSIDYWINKGCELTMTYLRNAKFPQPLGQRIVEAMAQAFKDKLTSTFLLENLKVATKVCNLSTFILYKERYRYTTEKTPSSTKEEGGTVQESWKCPSSEEREETITSDNNKMIFNLSKHIVPSSIFDILLLGIKYIPFYKQPRETVLSEFERLADTFKIKYLKIFKKIPHNWVYTVSRQCDKLMDIYSDFNLKHPSLDIRSLQEYLRHNRLILKPADKNLGWVICDLTWYESECFKHLEDTKTYKFIPRPDLKEIFTLLKGQLNNKFTKNFIKHIPKDPKVSRFHVLPKIHKNPITTRPIVPNFDTIISPLSKFLDKELAPLLLDFPWILRNSLDLINDLKIMTLHPNDKENKLLLVTADATSLYTNINTDKALNLLKAYYNKGKISMPKMRWMTIVRLIGFVLKNNYLQFKDKHYLQINGTAMGVAFAPNYAQLYLAILEEQNFRTNRDYKKIKYYRRYIDDTFTIINTSDLGVFTEFLTTLDDNISWTVLSSPKKISFLDVWLMIDYNTKLIGRISYEPFKKPLNLDHYTDPSSNYPARYKFSWITGENIRLLRNSSTQKTFEKAIKGFQKKLLLRKYSSEIITKYLIYTWDDRFRFYTKTKISKSTLSQYQIIPIQYTPYWDILNDSINDVIKCMDMNDHFTTILQRGISINDYSNVINKELLNN